MWFHPEWHACSGAGPRWQVQVHERCLELVRQRGCRKECSPLIMLRPQRLQCALHLCPKRQMYLLRARMAGMTKLRGDCRSVTAHCCGKSFRPSSCCGSEGCGVQCDCAPQQAAAPPEGSRGQE